MQHIAIDLGGRESRICVRDAEGKILQEQWWATARLSNYLKRQPVSRVVMETSSEAFAIADVAVQLGHDVRIVPATLVTSLGVGSRGVKTDKKDAQVLSEVSCRINLPSVHLPSPASREWKALCGTRECLVRARTKLINNVRGWLRTQVVHLRSGDVSTFASRVRVRLLSQPAGMPMYIERQLCGIEELNRQIREADKDLAQTAACEPRCQNLMTVPGIGPVTALRFLAAVDDVTRFHGAHALQSYLGLAPGEHSSSTRQRTTSITKAGSSPVRWLLVQAAWCALRTRRKDPMVQWAYEVAKRRGRQVAAVALSRKLAGILYAILRDGTRYQSRCGAQAAAAAADPSC